ncbi:SdrD B-like domain-containing protein [Arundinibacter roseus]|nr:SdrD B-like domain-containing protein [Arundinibacter roseus]
MNNFIPFTNIWLGTRVRFNIGFIRTFLYLGLFSLLHSQTYAQVSGTVFRDFNANGIRETTSPINEVGMAGVTVIATDAGGGSLAVTYTGGGTSTDITGEYSVASATPGAIRLEFVLPDSYTFASMGSLGGTTILFPNSTTQNLAVNYPADYCEGSADVIVPCFVFGNLTTFGTFETAVSDPFSTRVPPGTAPAHDKSWSTHSQTGSVYGTAYSRHTKKSYFAAYYKRYVGFGPGNGNATGSTGAIYEADGTGNVNVLIDLPDSETGVNPHPNTVDFQRDPSWWESGKISWGDIDISDDGKTLYAMNLFNRKLYEIDIANQSVLNSTFIPGIAGGIAFTGPTSDNDTDLRPFGVKYYKGKVYIGVVCTAESEITTDPYQGKNPNLQGIVFEFTPGTGFTPIPVTNFQLSGDNTVYTYLKPIKSFEYGYQMWGNQASLNQYFGGRFKDFDYFTRPVISDIDFINDDMIIGIRDLSKDQAANQSGTFYPDGTDATGFGASGSNSLLLKACKNGSGGFTIENNGQCGGITGANANNFYSQYVTHSTGDHMGGMGVFPAQQTIITNTLPGGDKGAIAFISESTKTFNLTNGVNIIYDYDYSAPLPNPLFGKANGLGDIEIACSVQSIEIGNRIWKDTNNDGIQDAGEDGIDGVEIELYEGTAATGSPVQTVISATLAGQKGSWYFTNLKANQDYVIKVKTALGTGVLASCTAFSPTGAGNVLTDNNSSSGTISLKTGNAGENNHSLDIGVSEATCTITLKPTVSGCYQNGEVSKATVSVEVAWANATVSPTANDASDSISVTFAGQRRTINPGAYTSTNGNGSILSPQVVAFEVDANGSSTADIQAFIGATYAAATCKAEIPNIVLPPACPPTVCTAGQTGGTVWNDFNADGIKQAGESTGLVNVIVKTFDCNGNEVGSTTTDAFGKYVFSNIASAAYPIRVEFSGLPTFAGHGTINGTDGRTTTQFVTSADCNVDLGILNPTDFCQTNPSIIIPCYVYGDPIPANSTSGNRDALVKFAYGSSGLYNASQITEVGSAKEVGTVWGVAYNKFTNKTFTSAFLKRHAGLGPLGLGGIYITDMVTNTSTPYVDVATIGINVGSLPGVGSPTNPNTGRGLSTNPADPSRDEAAFANVLKVGIGDLEIDETGSKLWLVNLADQKLYSIAIPNSGAPTASDVASFSIPNPGCEGGNWRPFGLKIYQGDIYIGGVCDAAVSKSQSNLRATVYKYTVATNTFTSILEFPLNYPKGFGLTDVPNKSQWQFWTDNFTDLITNDVSGSGKVTLSNPQPILTDIEFDIDGSMVLGFGDRTGIQTGFDNYAPTGTATTLYNGINAGDILRAFFLNGSTFVLENNGKAGPAEGYGPNNNQGPGFGEFYNDNWFNFNVDTPTNNIRHAEHVMGGLALRPGSGEVIVGVMDPLDVPKGANSNLYINTGGVRFLNNTTGISSRAFQLYRSTTGSGTFAKATGLGDIEIACSLPTYLEIGNRVWNDTNKNGVQDPCEKALSGVNVSLYKGTTKIADTKTNVNGEYYFSTASKIGAGWIGTGADTTLLPNTAYKLVFGEGQLSSGKLTVAGLGQFDLTIKDATANNGNDQNDSDAEVIGGAFCITLTTGVLASVNHTFDAGFVCTNPPIAATFTVVPASCNLTTENNDGKITLAAAVTPYDKFRTRLSSASWGADTSYATATVLGATFPADLVTAIPNAGGTYVIRFYTGECCYKDTTITVLPTGCTVGSLGDFVWKDLNDNGQQDASEPGVNGVKVILWSAVGGAPGAKLDSTTTAGNGAYSFSNLGKGDYIVQIDVTTLPDSCLISSKQNIGDDASDNDFTTAGLSPVVSLDPTLTGLNKDNPTIDAGLISPKGSLGDFVWKDLNDNGQQDAGEPGVNGVKVILWSAVGGAPGAKLDSTTTAGNGAYSFTNLGKGDYIVQIDVTTLPDSCLISSKQNIGNDASDNDFSTEGLSEVVTLDPTLTGLNKDNPTIDAGLISPKGSLGDFVWKDLNDNGQQDSGEPGVNGVKVILWSAVGGAPGAKLDSTTTAGNGAYSFTNLGKGDYIVQIDVTTLPDSCLISPKQNVGDDASDNDFTTAGLSPVVTLDPTLTGLNKNNPTIDAGLISPKGSLGDFVWKDLNDNGQQDAGEPSVNGVKVILWSAVGGAPGAKLDSTTTAGNGAYSFTNLGKGDYIVQIDVTTLPDSCLISSKQNIGNDSSDNDFTTAGLSPVVTLDPTLTGLNKDNPTIDAGLISPKGSLGDFVWKDLNDNGQQDAGEPGVNGVKVILWSAVGGAPGAKLDSTTTAGNGAYSFTNLGKGDYIVQIDLTTLPDSCLISSKQNIGDDASDNDFTTVGLSPVVTLDPTLTGLNKDNPTIDAGLISPKGSLGDFVWKDLNDNGQQDNGEPGVNGVKVILWSAVGGVPGAKLDSTVTAGNGAYNFTNLLAGDYIVQIDVAMLPDSCLISSKQNIGDDASDNDFTTAGLSPVVTLDPTLTGLNKDNPTIDAGLISPKGSLGDFVWKDLNDNGQQDAGEPGVNGVKVILWSAVGGVPGAKLDSTVTAGNGAYNFTNLLAGDYIVQIDVAMLPDSCLISSKQNIGDDASDNDFTTAGLSPVVTLDPTLTGLNKDNPTIDAGLISPKGSLGDFVWKDLNDNGQQDASEPGVNGVKVILWSAVGGAPGAKLDSTITAGNGAYSFTNLGKGDYIVQIDLTTLPDSCLISPKQNVGDDASDNDFTTAGLSPVVTLDPTLTGLNKDNPTIDAGLISPKGSLGDFVWKDLNDNGQQDAGEPGVNGVKVILWSANASGQPLAKLDSTTTAGNGAYSFTNLGKGDYIVQIDVTTLPDSCLISSKQNIGDDASDNDFTTAGLSPVVTLDPTLTGLNKDNPTIDAGLISPKGSLGDFVWKDLNDNGQQDAGEPGVNGVKVILWSAVGGAPGAKLDSTTTAGNGAYSFTNLGKGDYIVQIDLTTLPDSCLISPKQNIGNDASDNDFTTAGLSPVVTLDPTLTGLNKDNPTIDAGLISPKGSLGDFVWKDLNDNGQQDAGEPGVNGVKVILWSANASGQPLAKLDSTTTAGNGAYSFTNLLAGDYIVQIDVTTLPDSCLISSKQNIGDDASDNDFGTNGLSNVVSLDPTLTGLNKDNPTIDAGLISPCVAPTFAATDASMASCDGKTAQNDASFVVSGISGGNKFSFATSVSGLANYASATTLTGTSITVANLPNPTQTTGQTYIVRIYNGKDDCFTDVSILVPYSDCSNVCVKPNAGSDIFVCKPTTTADLPNAAAGAQWISAAMNPVGVSISAQTGVVSGMNENGVYMFILRDATLGSTCSDTVFVFRGVLELPNQTTCFDTLTLPTVAGATWTAMAGNPATITSSGKISGMNSVATNYSFIISNGQCSDTIVVTRLNCNKTYDLALDKAIDKKLAMLGETLTYTIRVWNEGEATAHGIEVTDELNAGVQYLSSTADIGSYSQLTKKWSFDSMMVGDTVSLQISVKVIAAGVWFNTAEITKMTEEDVDSTPGNGDETEDDIDRECFTVPILLCRGQSSGIELSVPEQYTGVVWFRQVQGGQPVQLAIGNTHTATETELGSYEYTFTSTSGTCPAEGCCPVVIVVEDCCPAEICVPFTITKTRK